MKPVHLIGAPLDLGGGRRGVDMGPSALRIAGLGEQIAALGRETSDRGNVPAPIRETVREIVIHQPVQAPRPAAQPKTPFRDISDNDLLGFGVPAEWLADVRNATEDSILTIADHLPAEAAEAMAGPICSCGGVTEHVQTLYAAIFQREPTQRELATCEKFLESQSPVELARALLNLNEFIYID